MFKGKFLSCLSLFSLAIASPVCAQDTVVSLDEAIKASKVLADFRIRYEGADFENPGLETADALTYRARVGLETGKFLGTQALIEFDHIQDLAGDFNSTQNGNAGFAVIADPNATELNRLQLKNTSIPDTTVTVGRQRIILDDARFVGNVGWRNNEQTYDAVRLTNKSVKGLTLDASYVDQVNRIFGPDAATGRFGSESWLLNAKYKVPVEGVDVSLSGFAYLLDLSNAGLSSDTYGAQIAAKKGKFGLTGRYATQEGAGDNPLDYTADHYMIEGHVKPAKGLTLAAGYEVLGADEDTDGRFTTPLATLHKFNGFADVFLGTPVAGLEDLYVKGVYKTGPVGSLPFIKLVGFYHDYSANEGDGDLGSEFNAVAVTKLGKNKLLFKFADYSAGDNAGAGRTRYSVQIDRKF